MNTKIDLNPKLVALIFSVLVLLFAIAFYIIIAWTEPTATPPGANVPTPINIGTTTQHKNGEIGATIFRDRDNTAWFVDPAGVSVLAGNVGIGTTTPAERLHVDGRVRLGVAPVHSLDAANKAYVDAAVGRAVYFTECRSCESSTITPSLCTPHACLSGWTDGGVIIVWQRTIGQVCGWGAGTQPFCNLGAGGETCRMGHVKRLCVQ